MYLGKTKRRLRYSISHGLGEVDLPNQLSPTDLVKAITEYKNGSVEARRILIETHLRLTIQIASGYVGRFRSKKEDIISAAMLGLVSAVDRAPRVLYNNNIAAYITTSVHSHIHDFLLHDQLIYIPAKRLQELRQTKLVPYTTTLTPKEDEDNLEYSNESDAEVLPEIYDINELEVLDFINQLDDMETMIFKLRVEEYNNVEIGARLGVSAEYVGQIRERIKEKYSRYQRRIEHESIRESQSHYGEGIDNSSRCQSESRLAQQL